MNVVAEFLVEPFREGALGPHVTAAIDALEQSGLSVEIGPFGSSVSGEVRETLEAMTDALVAAIESGASRVSLNVTVES